MAFYLKLANKERIRAPFREDINPNRVIFFDFLESLFAGLSRIIFYGDSSGTE